MNTNSNIDRLCVAIAQVNTLVGDIELNAQKVINLTIQAIEEFNADLVVFPELTLCSYPPEDLLYRSGLYQRIDAAIESICQQVKGISIVIGYPRKCTQGIYNMAGVIQDGKLVAEYAKCYLPNYSVFDEVRYFIPGDSTCIFKLKGFSIGLSICEDAWHSKLLLDTAQAGAELIVNLNASPFHVGKVKRREEVIKDRVLESKVPLIYVNQVGGQDELVFDGGSFVMSADCNIAFRAPEFVEHLACVEMFQSDYGLQVKASSQLKDQIHASYQLKLQSIYSALCLGLSDYVTKNGFTGLALGLSGGIDSALSLAIAVDALGAENVMAVSMPSVYTASMSIEDAKTQALTLKADFHVIEINQVQQSFLTSLEPLFAGFEKDTTEENIQARVRGVLLMAIANKHNRMVLTTGNKSEVAVGYCTLYGDMVGAYSVLKDVSKLLVYKLANYRNQVSEVIPQRVIDRPPSAELAPDQKDEDSLPPYEILDPIISLYVEQDKCLEEIVALGYERETVIRVIKLINQNEYKRRQAAPGVRITERAFGRDRRYPITSGFIRNLEDS